MAEKIGRSVRMSPARRFMGDLLHAGMQVPLVTIQKEMNVAELAAARRLAPTPPSWCAIFTKAYGKVVAARPDMRRTVLEFPWERMYEFSAAAADISAEVPLGDETALAFVPIKHPETHSLSEIDRIIASCQEDPLERLPTFKYALLVARCPRFVRRWVWWCLLNVSGRVRADYFGTFGVTSVGNWGIESVRAIAPTISILHYGAIDSKGHVSVRMTYDHRVLDGAGPSTAMNELEQILKTDILAELLALKQRGSPEGLLKLG